MVKTRKRKGQQNSHKTPLSPACKKSRKAAIEKYALEVVDARTRGKGQTHDKTYGSTAAIIHEARNLMPWITATMIKSKADRIKLARNTQLSTPPEQHPLLVGRPKGSTIQSQKDLRAREVEAKLLITDRLREAQEVAKNRNKSPVAKYTFKKIHDEVLKELGLDETNFSISSSTIKGRIRNKITTTTFGPPSPALEIEPLITTFARYRQEAGQPMKPSETIEFANSLIKESTIQQSVTKFHASCRTHPKTLLGRGWFAGFMRRQKEVLSSRKGTRKHNTRQDWTTYDNIENMYELIYKQMVDAGIAQHLPEDEHYWVDKAGEVVDTSEQAAGNKCTIELTHPEWLLFGDEVGTDTAQDDDGHIGGQTYLSYRGRKIELTSSKASGRFTLMGLTAASGDPVMCIVIMAGKEVGIAEVLGYDHQAETPYDTTKELDENCGPGKALPGLPTCTFRGKEVPALLTATPKGSMTSEILKTALKVIDDLGIYERTEDGPVPMCIFDGHESRLQLPFLQYVNQEMHGRSLWKACIGLPNGTTKWQVGDSEQQNGAYKMSMTKNKDLLVLYKRRNCFASIDFKKCDIVPLVCRAWADSFAKKKTNLHAISDRGWYYLDMRLLHDPDILQTRVTQVTQVTPPVDCWRIPHSEVSISSCPTNVSDLTPTDDNEYDPIGRLGLNLHEGAACDITNDVIRHLKRNGAVHEAFKEKKAEGLAVQARFEDYIGDSRMTAGAIFKSGRVLLGRDILNFRQKKEQDQLDGKLAIIKTAALKYHKRFETYTNLMESGYVATNEKKINKDLKVWLSVRKKKSDGPMPSVTKKLRELEEKLKGHGVLTLRDYLIDEGKEEDLIDQYLEHSITINQQHHAVLDTINRGVEDVVVGEQQVSFAVC